MHRLHPCLQACRDETIRRNLHAAGQAAIEAGAIIRARYGQPHDIRMKGTIDLVTEADLASERKILDLLATSCPGIPALSEEASATAAPPARLVWIVDPLDGTTNFAHGFPFCAVSIALCDGNESLLGVVYNPILEELFCAARDSGAWLNGTRLAVTGCDRLGSALVGTGFPYNIEESLGPVVRTVERVLPRVRDLRRAGAAAIDLAYVACGRLDAFWEINLKPWDTAAGRLLVEEAGGRLTDFAGRPFSPFVPETVASNGHLHGALLELLRGPAGA